MYHCSQVTSVSYTQQTGKIRSRGMQHIRICLVEAILYFFFSLPCLHGTLFSWTQWFLYLEFYVFFTLNLSADVSVWRSTSKVKWSWWLSIDFKRNEKGSSLTFVQPWIWERGSVGGGVSTVWVEKERHTSFTGLLWGYNKGRENSVLSVPIGEKSGA